MVLERVQVIIQPLYYCLHSEATAQYQLRTYTPLDITLVVDGYWLGAMPKRYWGNCLCV